MDNALRKRYYTCESLLYPPWEIRLHASFSKKKIAIIINSKKECGLGEHLSPFKPGKQMRWLLCTRDVYINK